VPGFGGLSYRVGEFIGMGERDCSFLEAARMTSAICKSKQTGGQMIGKSMLSAIAGILLLVGGTLPASAQSCGDLYNRMMAAYQGGSPQYPELVGRYNARCAAAPAPARRAGGQCEELRLACESKDRLGEQGEGNCRRYRQTCQQPSRAQVCEELRTACLQKDRLGEQGEGNCRRYRESCRR
jgi:hypothetical protein